jgi:hypothetical protein
LVQRLLIMGGDEEIAVAQVEAAIGLLAPAVTMSGHPFPSINLCVMHATVLNALIFFTSWKSMIAM